MLGRNCRFLQGPDTDAAAVARLRAAVDAGAEIREVLLNQRTDGTSWWNECHLTPVTDDEGRVVQYIGVQADVTARVEAERALLTEQERSRRYEAQLARLDAQRGGAKVTLPAQTSTESPGVRRS